MRPPFDVSTSAADLPQVAALLAGEWALGEGNRITVLDKYTLEPFAEVPASSPEQIRRMIDAGQTAFENDRLTPYERGRILDGVADLLSSRRSEALAIMQRETGFTVSDCNGEIARTIDTLRLSAEEARRLAGEVIPLAGAAGQGNRFAYTLRVPLGIVLAVTPFNAPLNTVTHKIAPALGAGNVVLLKPAGQTPRSACFLASLFVEAGLPPAYLQIFHGSGEEVSLAIEDERVRFIAFTGSTEVGLMLARRPSAVLRRVSLEMGGHSPAIVFPDADIEATAANIMLAKFPNAGQSCISINRLFLHRSIADELTTKLVERVGQLRLGRGLTEGVTTGPLIDFAGLDKVERHVTGAVAKGAEVLIGGKRWTPDDPRLKGAFYEPTVLTNVDEGMEIAHEETFGPVLPIYTFDDDDDVIARANNTTYGLAAYVFGSDFNRIWDAMERLEFGVIGVNDPLPNRPELPFGGFKNSGQGREGGTEGIEDYVETKAVAIKK